MTYRFAIGGTDADYQKAWGNFGFRKIRLPFIDKKGIIAITICRPI